MASQVHIANCQAGNFLRLSARHEDRFRHMPATEAEPSGELSKVAGDSPGRILTPEVIAFGVEFVALPGQAAKLQTAIPEAMCNEFRDHGGFSGCMVLVPEQEARLVTVITLWTGRDRARLCNENARRIEKLLVPYVDRWLRTRRLAAFLCAR